MNKKQALAKARKKFGPTAFARVEKGKEPYKIGIVRDGEEVVLGSGWNFQEAFWNYEEWGAFFMERNETKG
ncbi:hypothetical protein E2P64_06485 [Candidatus Bathyarchaeota archaeon]|nr:hypothetical protein E2P64_06485 [Candidatus Bathyarchaeota archaeon]